jgi:hypothetical protein
MTELHVELGLKIGEAISMLQSNAEIAQFIRLHAIELAKLAKSNELVFASYLLEMVALELENREGRRPDDGEATESSRQRQTCVAV